MNTNAHTFTWYKLALYYSREHSVAKQKLQYNGFVGVVVVFAKHRVDVITCKKSFCVVL